MPRRHHLINRPPPALRRRALLLEKTPIIAPTMKQHYNYGELLPSKIALQPNSFSTCCKPSRQGNYQNAGEALTWDLKAPEQSYTSAQYNHSNRYRRGDGIPKNHAAAVRWGRAAADHGQATSQAILGMMHANGLGVPCETWCEPICVA